MSADPADASLAGPPGDGRGPLVALGDTGAPGVPALRWLDRLPRSGDPPERVIAPAGDGAWRHAPWPAADALFELAPPSGTAVALTGGNAGLRAAVAEHAAARGVALEPIVRLDARELRRCACVILAECPGGALPARAPAVLAAGRLLIVPRLRTAFGLQDGLDHVEFADPDEAVTLVQAYCRAPAAFARMLVWGRVAAEAQRASVVYARLAADLRLHDHGRRA